MSESNKKLVSVPPENMDINSLIGWFGNQFSASAEIFKEAEQYYSDLKKHHQNLSTLMRLMQDLKEAEEPDKDEVDEIVDTASEVIEAIQHLHDDRQSLSSDGLDAEEAGAELLATDEGKAAEVELQQDVGVFIKNYNTLKAKLNLKTQQDVADLTGIDRRYISIIEKGKHKPQFKTLKRLAEAFGVEVEQLTS